MAPLVIVQKSKADGRWGRKVVVSSATLGVGNKLLRLGSCKDREILWDSASHSRRFCMGTGTTSHGHQESILGEDAAGSSWQLQHLQTDFRQVILSVFTKRNKVLSL